MEAKEDGQSIRGHGKLNKKGNEKKRTALSKNVHHIYTLMCVFAQFKLKALTNQRGNYQNMAERNG